MCGPTDSPPEVFISYARRDEDRVLAIVDRLRDAGVSVWIDREGIGGGSSWARTIGPAIAASKVVLLFGSEHAFAEESRVADEIDLAYNERKEILLVQLDGEIPIPASLKLQLQSRNYRNLYGRDQKAAFAEILDDLQGWGVSLSAAAAAADRRRRESSVAAKRVRFALGAVLLAALPAAVFFFVQRFSGFSDPAVRRGWALGAAGATVLPPILFGITRGLLHDTKRRGVKAAVASTLRGLVRIPIVVTASVLVAALFAVVVAAGPRREVPPFLWVRIPDVDLGVREFGQLEVKLDGKRLDIVGEAVDPPKGEDGRRYTSERYASLLVREAGRYDKWSELVRELADEAAAEALQRPADFVVTAWKQFDDVELPSGALADFTEVSAQFSIRPAGDFEPGVLESLEPLRSTLEDTCPVETELPAQPRERP